jgi:hypothetical protein
MELTTARLHELLRYDPSTGVFTWRMSRGSRAAGQTTGAVNSHGYVLIGLDGTIWKAHQLAWLYVTGEWPREWIDHRDGDKANNRFTNLRLASFGINAQNRRTANRGARAGLLGVCATSAGRWQAAIVIPGDKRRYIGVFDTPEEAHAAYVEAKRQHHPGCTI